MEAAFTVLLFVYTQREKLQLTFSDFLAIKLF